MPGTAADLAPLHARLRPGLLGSANEGVANALAELAGQAEGLPGAAPLSEPPVRHLLDGVFSASPYLTGLIMRDSQRLLRLLGAVPEQQIEALIAEIGRRSASFGSLPELMTELRGFKAEVALLTALADLGGVWPLEQVTKALAVAADTAVRTTVAFLFREAVR